MVTEGHGTYMAMEMDNIELMVELQVFTHIHDQRAVHRQFTPWYTNTESLKYCLLVQLRFKLIMMMMNVNI